MSEIWLTSDFHLNHNKEFVYGERGFSSVEEMNETIVERWNEVVKKDDIVYNLGDFVMSDVQLSIPYIKALNGNIKWIFGNHDSEKKVDMICEANPNIQVVGWAEMLKYEKKYFYLSHFPTLTSNADDSHLWHRVINLYGHTHQQTNFLYPDNPFIYHVGVDSHNCYPVNIEEIITDIKNRYYEISRLGIERQPLYDFTKE